jgi:hypothetical protein
MKNEEYFEKMFKYVAEGCDVSAGVEQRMMSAFREIERTVRHRCAEKANELSRAIMNIADYNN